MVHVGFFIKKPYFVKSCIPILIVIVDNYIRVPSNSVINWFCQLIPHYPCKVSVNLVCEE